MVRACSILVQMIQAVVKHPEGKSYILTSSFTGKFHSTCLAVMKRIEEGYEAKTVRPKDPEERSELVGMISRVYAVTLDLIDDAHSVKHAIGRLEQWQAHMAPDLRIPEFVPSSDYMSKHTIRKLLEMFKSSCAILKPAWVGFSAESEAIVKILDCAGCLARNPKYLKITVLEESSDCDFSLLIWFVKQSIRANQDTSVALRWLNMVHTFVHYSRSLDSDSSVRKRLSVFLTGQKKFEEFQRVVFDICDRFKDLDMDCSPF